MNLKLKTKDIKVELLWWFETDPKREGRDVVPFMEVYHLTPLIYRWSKQREKRPQ